MDAMRPHVDKLGFFTIWRAPDHDDHMHIDAVDLAPRPGGGGFAGPIDDVPLDVRLVDWDKELPAPPSSRRSRRRARYGGAPDLKIVALICGLAQPYGPKLRLAAFEAAIVESGHPQPQLRRRRLPRRVPAAVERRGLGHEGADTMDPCTRRARSCGWRRRWAGRACTAGELAARVQRPREDLRGRYAAVEGQAAGADPGALLMRALVLAALLLALLGAGCGADDERAAAPAPVAPRDIDPTVAAPRGAARRRDRGGRPEALRRSSTPARSRSSTCTGAIGIRPADARVRQGRADGGRRVERVDRRRRRGPRDDGRAGLRPSCAQGTS